MLTSKLYSKLRENNTFIKIVSSYIKLKNAYFSIRGLQKLSRIKVIFSIGWVNKN